MNFEKIYRHGDVIIFRLPDNESPLEGKKTKKTPKLTLALGEVTGHAHVLEGNMEVLEAENEEIYFEVQDRAVLTHEEHDVMVLDKGIYLKVNQVEYDPYNDIIRYVRD